MEAIDFLVNTAFVYACSKTSDMMILFSHITTISVLFCCPASHSSHKIHKGIKFLQYLLDMSATI